MQVKVSLISHVSDVQRKKALEEHLEGILNCYRDAFDLFCLGATIEVKDHQDTPFKLRINHIQQSVDSHIEIQDLRAVCALNVIIT